MSNQELPASNLEGEPSMALTDGASPELDAEIENIRSESKYMHATIPTFPPPEMQC